MKHAVQKKKKIDIIIFVILLLAALGVFIPYAVSSISSDGFGWGHISSIVCLALFMLLIYRFIPTLTGYWLNKDESIKREPLTLDDKRARYTAWLKICLFILAVKIATYMVGYIVAVSAGNVHGDFFGTFDRLWCTRGIDAPSYLGIAENWYQTSGDAMYHIVFFPFYPITIKAVQLIAGDYLLSGVLVSTLCSFGIGIVGYELISLDYDDKTAFRFVKYTFLLPGAFFFCTPMTEALFVLLCLLCLLFTRKRNFVLAAVFGALAAFTRSAGVLLMVPMGIEYIRILIETKRDKKEKDRFAARLFGLGALVLSVSLGLLAYIFINYSLWGNPLQFSVFQSEHWGQRLGWFFNTANYETKYFIKDLNNYLADTTNVSQLYRTMSLFSGNLVYIIGSLPVVALAAHKLKPKYTGYFIAYYVFSIGATWLLSAPRYLMASITLPLAFALLSDKRWKDAVWTAVLSVLSLGFLILFALRAPIY